MVRYAVKGESILINKLDCTKIGISKGASLKHGISCVGFVKMLRRWLHDVDAFNSSPISLLLAVL